NTAFRHPLHLEVHKFRQLIPVGLNGLNIAICSKQFRNSIIVEVADPAGPGPAACLTGAELGYLRHPSTTTVEIHAVLRQLLRNEVCQVITQHEHIGTGELSLLDVCSSS